MHRALANHNKHNIFQPIKASRHLALAPVACSPALGAGCMFSRAWRRLYVLPRLAPVVCSPALGAGCMFSRAWRRLRVFPRLAPVACLFASSPDRLVALSVKRK